METGPKVGIALASIVILVLVIVLPIVLTGNGATPTALPRAVQPPTYVSPPGLMTKYSECGPIDYVTTWVDLLDEEWHKEYTKATGHTFEPTPNGEIFYTIRSVRRYMPWIRNIYVLTQRPQRPSWADEEGVTIVHHDECGLEEPTFNGMVTRTLVPHIPGLADRYITGDDDTCFMKPRVPEDYFRGMVPKMRCVRHASETPSDDMSLFDVIVHNTFEHLRDTCGFKGPVGQSSMHMVYPVNKAYALRALEAMNSKPPTFGAKRSREDIEFFVTYYPTYVVTHEQYILSDAKHGDWEHGMDIEPYETLNFARENSLFEEAKVLLDNRFGERPW